MSMNLEGLKIESVEIDHAVVVDSTDPHPVILPCEDEEDAYAMQYMFGGEVIERKVYIGEWYVVQTEDRVSPTG